MRNVAPAIFQLLKCEIILQTYVECNVIVIVNPTRTGPHYFWGECRTILKRDGPRRKSHALGYEYRSVITSRVITFITLMHTFMFNLEAREQVQVDNRPTVPS